jgi:PIN domain nuclease of toxin-antitoxin system
MIVLDTHVFLWTVLSLPKLGRAARRHIEQAAKRRELAISTISYGEIAMLAEAQRLRMRVELGQIRDAALRTGLLEAPVDFEIAVLTGRLTGMHGDPADRIVVATALAHNATLITADQAILSLPGGPRCVDAQS